MATYASYVSGALNSTRIMGQFTGSKVQNSCKADFIGQNFLVFSLIYPFYFALKLQVD